jgi:hypothetical protein
MTSGTQQSFDAAPIGLGSAPGMSGSSMKIEGGHGQDHGGGDVSDATVIAESKG